MTEPNRKCGLLKGVGRVGESDSGAINKQRRERRWIRRKGKEGKGRHTHATPSTQGAEAGGLCVQDQPELSSKIMT